MKRQNSMVSSPLTAEKLRDILNLLPEDTGISGNDLGNLVIWEDEAYVGWIDLNDGDFHYWGTVGEMRSGNDDY
jgi:hypothetical protein